MYTAHPRGTEFGREGSYARGRTGTNPSQSQPNHLSRNPGKLHNQRASGARSRKSRGHIASVVFERLTITKTSDRSTLHGSEIKGIDNNTSCNIYVSFVALQPVFQP